jgi:hypothetical protein
VDPIERKNQLGAVKEPFVAVNRQQNKNSPPVVYHVTDNTSKFTPKDWYGH